MSVCLKVWKRTQTDTKVTFHPPAIATRKLFLVSNERYGQNKTFLLWCYGIDCAPIKRNSPFCFFLWLYIRRLRFSLCDLSVYISDLLSVFLTALHYFFLFLSVCPSDSQVVLLSVWLSSFPSVCSSVFCFVYLSVFPNSKWKCAFFKNDNCNPIWFWVKMTPDINPV